jgi:hypothetical protein
MRSLRASFIAGLLVLAATLPGPVIARTHSEEVFKRLQSLAGNWAGKDDQGKPVKSRFKAIVSNTAVMETLSAAGMDEMVTLYSLDGDGIALIHFCPTNNQPRMRFVPASDNIKELTFDFQGAGNLSSPATGHEHHLVIRLDDADHITETWTWRQDGKDMPTTYRLARAEP